uniref:Transposase n=1 Tax=Heterorhabditis bacteriophora TaxID=37862 RepID=A0A1I7XDK4_HETBA
MLLASVVCQNTGIGYLHLLHELGLVHKKLLPRKEDADNCDTTKLGCRSIKYYAIFYPDKKHLWLPEQ